MFENISYNKIDNKIWLKFEECGKVSFYVSRTVQPFDHSERFIISNGKIEIMNECENFMEDL